VLQAWADQTADHIDQK